jgi:hypothetical protein
MTLLAQPTPTRSRSAKPSRRADKAHAPCVVDAAGGVWTHPNPLHLYHWIDRRNDLLRTLAAAPRRAN